MAAAGVSCQTLGPKRVSITARIGAPCAAYQPGRFLDRIRAARAVVGHQRHMADLHHKIRRDRRQQLGTGGVQAEGHAVCAVGVDHAAGVGIELARGGINLAVQGDGFAAFVAADLLALTIKFGQSCRVQKTQTRVGGRDEEAVIEAHADVARRGVHVAALKQASAHAADLFTGLGFGRAHAKTVKALLKKSSVPKLPDLSVMCTPPVDDGA
jgi:hypothetical protein